MWKICGYELEAGEKRQVLIPIDMGELPHEGRPVLIPEGIPGSETENAYLLPATLAAGKEPGKTALISAGIHSGEYVGIPAVTRAAAEIDPALMKGNIIFLHCVNISGFWKDSFAVVPEDGFNLNKHYPGKAEGTVGERIADYFCREIFPKVDFILDFHGGSVSEWMNPVIFFPKKDSVREAALSAAKALGVEYLVESTAVSGQYSYAATHFDIPGFILERGSGFFSHRSQEDEDLRDIRLLLNHLEIYPYSGKRPEIPRIVSRENIYLDAEEQGIWRPANDTKAFVKKGQPLGRTCDFYGNVIHEYLAEDDCVIFYEYTGLPVQKGSFLAAYGLTRSMEKG